MSKTITKVFKIGELVKIINPEVFVRCGYPFDKKYAKENLITKEETEKISLNKAKVNLL